MTRALFVYWKTEPAHAAAAAAALQAWQAQLRQDHPALGAALYRRADDAGALVTLMETYAAPGGLGDALRSRLIEDGDTVCSPWCIGRRHVEVFEPWPGAESSTGPGRAGDRAVASLPGDGTAC